MGEVEAQKRNSEWQIKRGQVRPIPSLDGLRAASVALVILAHHTTNLPSLAALDWVGYSGVDVFFVISGFLITYLLLKENEAAGAISLKNFYFRRFFRIFPPFYVYLAVIGILWATGVFPQTARNFISAATYTWNYQHHSGDSWLLGHTWSLSIEEQFYLLWPPCLVLLGRKRSTYLAIGVILFSPATRGLTYFMAPSLRGAEGMMLHTRLDILMFGCAMALLWKDAHFNAFADRLLHPGLFAFSVFYIVVLAPLLSSRFQARYDWTVGYTIRGFLISIVLLYVVRKPASLPGRFLNLGPIAHVGVVSYSLYLWQQMFSGPNAFLFPLDALAALACAELSFWLIERPSLRLRDSLAGRLRIAAAKSTINSGASAAVER